MRKIGVSFFAVLLLLFFASSIQAQNQSADNSDAILFNGWYEWVGWLDCPQTGIIVFTGSVHEIVKGYANGTTTFHANATGVGTDEYGRVWRWRDTWNQKFPADYPDNFHQTRNVIAQGPKNAKMDFKSMWVIRDGEIVNHVFDPGCD